MNTRCIFVTFHTLHNCTCMYAYTCGHMYILFIYMYVLSTCILCSGSIAECIKQKLPYAQVTGVETEDEILTALSSVTPPITLDEKQFEGLGLHINGPLGCFIRGAGTPVLVLVNHGCECITCIWLNNKVLCPRAATFCIGYRIAGNFQCVQIFGCFSGR